MKEPLEFLRISKRDLEASLEEVKQRLQSLNPKTIAEQTGILLEKEKVESCFRFFCFSREITVTVPEFDVLEKSGREADLLIKGLVLHYLDTAGKTTSPPPVEEENTREGWISLREIPGGTFYAVAFQSYTGDELIRKFGSNTDALKEASYKLGGQAVDLGDIGFTFQVLPRVKACMVYWRGDDDFPPSAHILFQKEAGNYLPCDALAVMGAQLVKNLCNLL